MMTREDVLRELELLPIWQLRAPLKPLVVVDNPVLHDEPVVEVTSVVEPALEKSAYEIPLSFAPESALETAPEVIQEPLTEAVAAESISYQCIASDDNAYLFILAAELLTADAQTLLNNIWRAMRVNVKPAFSSTVATLDLTPHQVMIAMGESVAQQLLARTELLQSLREQPLTYQDKPLVVTYDAAYLLENSANKPQAWADLISAMQIVHDLKFTKAASSKM